MTVHGRLSLGLSPPVTIISLSVSWDYVQCRAQQCSVPYDSKLGVSEPRCATIVYAELCLRYSLSDWLASFSVALAEFKNSRQ